MLLTMLKGKIHRAVVTQAELDYVGSITIDEQLMEAAGIQEYERVQVVDVNNGQRLETYAIAGERNSGVVCLNGAAARLVQPGEVRAFRPKVVFVDPLNRVVRVADYEKHGSLADV